MKKKAGSIKKNIVKPAPNWTTRSPEWAVERYVDFPRLGSFAVFEAPHNLIMVGRVLEVLPSSTPMSFYRYQTRKQNGNKGEQRKHTTKLCSIIQQYPLVQTKVSWTSSIKIKYDRNDHTERKYLLIYYIRILIDDQCIKIKTNIKNTLNGPMLC